MPPTAIVETTRYFPPIKPENRSSGRGSGAAICAVKVPCSEMVRTTDDDAVDDDIEGATRHVQRPASPDGAVLVVLSGAAKGAVLTIPGNVGAVCNVGKADDNDLVLRDDTVSRRHLEIARTAEGLHVRDLGSTNATRIGG